MALDHGVAVPNFGSPAVQYDRENESQFRREMERMLTSMVAFVEQVASDPSAFAAHELASSTALGDQHTVAGLTAGHVLTADSATAASFQAFSLPSHTHNADDVNAGTLADARIPSLNASKITAGTFSVSRIPDLNASKIDAGTFGTGNYSFPGTLTVAGSVNLNGGLCTLGNSTADQVLFTARVGSDIDPSTNNARALGSSSLAWKEVYWAAGGALRDDQGGSIELGDTGSFTPFIDWHSHSTSKDYDYRMIAVGGTTSNGGGRMSYIGLTHQFETGGLTVGVPTGGQKGNGTINVRTNIYRQNSTYNHPDYVFEEHFIGPGEGPSRRPHEPRGDDGEDDEGWYYPGRRTLAQVKAHIAVHHQMPNIRGGPMGIFDRTDVLLEMLEEGVLYDIEHNEAIEALQQRVVALEAGQTPE